MDKHYLYMKAFKKTLDNYIKNKYADDVKSLIFYGVKIVKDEKDSQSMSKEDISRDFAFISYLKDMMSTLTPREFINIFPIAKEYKGHKYGTKDYFYTKKYIENLNMDSPIGLQGDILDFLWEYHNWDISKFVVKSMSCISNLRRLDGQPTLFEEFANEMGLKTYTMHTDSNGKQFLLDDETGKTTRVSKPKHLKVVK